MYVYHRSTTLAGCRIIMTNNMLIFTFIHVHVIVTIFDNTDVMSLILLITTAKFPKEIYILSETYK